MCDTCEFQARDVMEPGWGGVLGEGGYMLGLWRVDRSRIWIWPDPPPLFFGFVCCVYELNQMKG